MKKVLPYLLLLVGAFACKPEAYTGPLDSPVGNWEGIQTEYYFNNEKVADVPTCEYSAITFYDKGVCCIENVQGVFEFTYDKTTRELLIDGREWHVETLTGEKMVMETQVTETTTKSEDSNEETEEELPPVYDYKGITITMDEGGYYYMEGDEVIYCNYVGGKDENGELVIDFWYDSHVDHFIPLVVEVQKK